MHLVDIAFAIDSCWGTTANGMQATRARHSDCSIVACVPLPRYGPVYVGSLKLLVFGYCDNSMREKDWRCRMRGVQATRTRQGDLAGVTRARPRQAL